MGQQGEQHQQQHQGEDATKARASCTLHLPRTTLYCPLYRPAVVTKVSDQELYIVVNAGCREKDLAHLGQHLAAWKVRCGAAAAAAASLPPHPSLPLWCGGGHLVRIACLSCCRCKLTRPRPLPLTPPFPPLPPPPRAPPPTPPRLPQAKGAQVDMQVHDDRSLLALQGPEAVAVLQQFVKADLSQVYFSNFRKLDIKGVPCFLTRTG